LPTTMRSLVIACAMVAGATTGMAETATPWSEGYNSRARLIAGTVTKPGGPMRTIAGVEIVMADGWKTITKVFVLVIVLDLVYQFITGGPVLVRQSIILAILLAVIPYLFLRGIVTRIARIFRGHA